MTDNPYHAVVLDAYRRRVVPMPAHVAIAFWRAVGLAREAGVVFGQGGVAVWCYAGREDEPSVTFFRDRPVLVYLNLALPFFGNARELTWHILHEFSHAFHDARATSASCNARCGLTGSPTARWRAGGGEMDEWRENHGTAPIFPWRRLGGDR